jgi:tetratricopeptide (TPR) repeat protein
MYTDAHIELGNSRRRNNDLDAAIAEYRKAIAIDPKRALPRYNVAILLHYKQDLDGAIAEYRKALELDPMYAEARCNLAFVLEDKGQFAEALTFMRRGHELGSKNPRWSYPSEEWVKKCEHFVELDAKLPAILSGKEQPADAGHRAEYADVCQKKHLYSSATRLYRKAIAAQPDLVVPPDNGLRYNAACAAALAGCGQGKDADNLAAEEYAFLRQQALTWLGADLVAWRQILEKDGDKARAKVVQTMTHWQQDSDFTGVRGKEALGKLPEDERQGWEKLWQEAAALKKRAEARP